MHIYNRPNFQFGVRVLFFVSPPLIATLEILKNYSLEVVYNNAYNYYQQCPFSLQKSRMFSAETLLW